MTGRPTKLNKTVQNKIVKLIKTGVNVVDACQYVGLAERTFYDWMERGKNGDAEFSQFSQLVNRARNTAKIAAINTIRNAMSPTVSKTTKTHRITETRENIYGKPYEYKLVDEQETVIETPGDWRAAVEYLKRRFSDEWGDRQKIEDWRTQAIADIRAGKIPYEALADAFDSSLAAELFTAAGVSVQVGESAE